MATSTRTLSLALPALLLAVGCAGTDGPGAAIAGLSSGTTAIRVANHVEAPAELDRLIITIDGEPIALSSIPPRGGAVAVVARLKLAPGAHAVAVRARGRGAESDVIVVGAQQPFHVGSAPAAVTVDVSSRTGSPVAVSLAIVGGHMAPDLGAPPSDDKDARCAALLPIPRAICRAAVDLDEAARRNDIVAALCVRDKLAEMRRLAMVGDAAKGEAIAMAEAEVAHLAHQVELCGGDIAAPQPDGVTVIPPSRPE